MYAIHMRAASARIERESAERRAIAWMTAMLPHMKKPPSFAEFVNGKEDRRAFLAEREARFDAMDRALAKRRG